MTLATYHVLLKVSFWPVGVRLSLADAAAIKVSYLNVARYQTDLIHWQELTSSRTRFPKPTRVYRALSVYGPNVLVTEGDVWKRFRKLTAPAFSEVIIF